MKIPVRKWRQEAKSVLREEGQNLSNCQNSLRDPHANKLSHFIKGKDLALFKSLTLRIMGKQIFGV